MPESQQHGFIFEAAVMRAYGLDPTAVQKGGGARSYTREHDIPAELNTKEPGVNVSIKSFGGNSVDMGDVLRIYDLVSSATPCRLEAINYTQEGETKTIHRIYRLRLDAPNTLRTLFGTVTREELVAYCALVTAIPAGPPTAEQRASYHTEKERLNAKMGALQLRPKVDTKKQRRVQCSIPKMAELVTVLGGEVVADRSLFGTELPASIASGRRVRAARGAAAADE